MTAYRETLQWMFSKLPMYQRMGKQAFKKDLHNILRFSARLKNPHLAYPVIHVAGTNGKGSVSSMLASVFQEAGYKTGLYTSPHLKDFRERIRVNGEMIPQGRVVDFIRKHKTFLEENRLSFFEMTVGMAFDYFREQKVDMAIVETGLGGRLDSTNIVSPVLSVITNVQYDHTDMLGDTLEKIAYEKAGIIKEKTPVIVGEKRPGIVEVFRKIAAEKSAEIIWAEELGTGEYTTDLTGPYQTKNLRTALAAVKILRQLGFVLPEDIVKNGLMHVKRNTGLRGRWEILQKNPLILADSAHNPEAFAQVMDHLKKIPFEREFYVLGFVEGKNLPAMIDHLPHHAQVFLSTPRVPRGLNKEKAGRIFYQMGHVPILFPSVSKAYQTAKKLALPGDLIFVGGSTFTVAEVVD